MCVRACVCACVVGLSDKIAIIFINGNRAGHLDLYPYEVCGKDVCVVCERERQRDGEGQRQRQRDRDTDADTDSDRDGDSHLELYPYEVCGKDVCVVCVRERDRDALTRCVVKMCV